MMIQKYNYYYSSRREISIRPQLKFRGKKGPGASVDGNDEQKVELRALYYSVSPKLSSTIVIIIMKVALYGKEGV